jgi:hypothetical protein
MGGVYAVLAGFGLSLLDTDTPSERKKDRLTVVARTAGAWLATVATSILLIPVNTVAMVFAGTLVTLAVSALLLGFFSRSGTTGFTPQPTQDELTASVLLGMWVGLGAFALTLLQPLLPLGVFLGVTVLWRPDSWFGTTPQGGNVRE